MHVWGAFCGCRSWSQVLEPGVAGAYYQEDLGNHATAQMEGHPTLRRQQVSFVAQAAPALVPCMLLPSSLPLARPIPSPTHADGPLVVNPLAVDRCTVGMGVQRLSMSLFGCMLSACSPVCPCAFVCVLQPAPAHGPCPLRARPHLG